MTEQECLNKMVAPGTNRPGKYGSSWGFGGVMQILVTSSCDKACFGCTQASQLQRKLWVMTPEQFEQAVRSLGFTENGLGEYPKYGPSKVKDAAYPGVVGLFGGNPATSKHFANYCEILQRLVPWQQRGIWCNNPIKPENAQLMRATFNPAVSNINVHMDWNAFKMFLEHWPEVRAVGLKEDSRHSPPWVAMKDVVTKPCETCKGEGGWRESDGEPTVCDDCGGECKVPDDSRIWELISTCDINQHWSAMIGVFRGELRAWFCEVAGAQAILHQDEPDYPDTGLKLNEWPRTNGITDTQHQWWQLGMPWFRDQVRKHCFECGVPLRGYGELAQNKSPDAKEHVSATHVAKFKPKTPGRQVEIVTDLVQLGMGRIQKVNHYLQNAGV